MSDFEKWWKDEPLPSEEKSALAVVFYNLSKALSQKSWDYQQEKIDKLEEDRRKLMNALLVYKRAINFYADSADMFDGYDMWEDTSDVCQDNLCVEVLGRRAREARDRVKEMLE
jgi:hypothetical protein